MGGEPISGREGGFEPQIEFGFGTVARGRGSRGKVGVGRGIHVERIVEEGLELVGVHDEGHGVLVGCVLVSYHCWACEMEIVMLGEEGGLGIYTHVRSSDSGASPSCLRWVASDWRQPSRTGPGRAGGCDWI